MSSDLLTRLSSLPTPALSDVMRRKGLDPHTMHSTMKPVWLGASVCGPAFTVRTYPGATHGCDLALEQALPGDVLVIAAGGYTEVIMWGEIYSTMAWRKGLSGTVIDGAARDITGIREVGYPVFARAVTPRGGTGDSTQSETQVPVACAGVMVRPGDYVRGDENGVVVVPVETAEEVTEAAEALLQKETRTLELLHADMPVQDLQRVLEEEGL